MRTTNLRKVGGSGLLAVPPAIPGLLHLEVGATVGLAIDGERLVIDPKSKPRYTLTELLQTSEYYAAQSQEDQGAAQDWLSSPAAGGGLL